MKNLYILIFITLTLTIGCSKDNFETGIKGTIMHGEGDCMPTIDDDNREYDNYKGDLFFIVKEDLDNLVNGHFEQLKNNSIVIFIKRGQLSAELPIGTYVVMPEDTYLYSEGNTIKINKGEILNKNFKFWKCTSY